MPYTHFSQCSVVIRCYNEEQHIGRILSGIMQQTVRNVEIIVVDSGSTDATLSIASRYRVKVLSIRPEAFSFGRSLNIGCKASNDEFIVIASGHVYPVYKDWLERLLAPFSDPQVALVYGKQRGNESTQYAEHRVFEQWFPEESDFDQRHPFCNNANAAIRRKVWTEIPYDEDLTGLEDLDWARTVMTQGYSVAYVADAEIIHVHEESPSQTFNRYRREAIALKRIYPEQHMRFHEFVKLYCSSLTSDLVNAIRDGQLWGNISSIASFRLMQYWGAYQGFKQQGAVSLELKQRFYYPGRLSLPARNKEKNPEEAIDYSSSAQRNEIDVD